MIYLCSLEGIQLVLLLVTFLLSLIPPLPNRTPEINTNDSWYIERRLRKPIDLLTVVLSRSAT